MPYLYMIYANFIRYKSLSLSSSYLTFSEHPGCSGTFYEKADNVRLHGMFEPRFYKPDGSFIES